MLNPFHAEFVIFDIETTGLSVMDGDRIIEIAAARVKGGKVIDQYATFVNPKRPLNAEAMKTNGITEKMVKGQPTADIVLPQFLDFVAGSAIVAHNASFDIKFIAYELALYGRRIKDSTIVIDSLKMARALLPQLGSFRLEYLANALGVRVKETHRAMADVELLTQVFHKLLYMTEDHGLADLREVYARFSIEKPLMKFKNKEENMTLF